MFLSEFRRRTSYLSDYLPWSHLVREDVVALKDGAWLAGFAIAPLDAAALGKSERLAVRMRLSAAMAQLGGGWAMWVEERSVSAPSYPLAVDDGAPDVVRLIDEERRRLFEADRQRRKVTTFWLAHYGLEWDAFSDRMSELLLERADDERSAAVRAVWSRFCESLDEFEALLGSALASVERLRAGRMLSALASSIAPDLKDIRMPDVPVYLDAWLPTADFLPGLRPQLGEHHLRIVSVRDLPGTTTPDILDGLSSLDFPYRWCSRWLALDREEARRLMRSARRRWQAKARPALSVVAEMLHGEPGDQVSDPEAALMIDDSDEALASLAEAGIAYGLYSACVVVGDTDAAVADRRASDVLQCLSAAGIPAKSESFGAADIWLGGVPGDVKANVRRFPLHSASLADLLPHHGHWLGHDDRQIAMLHTRSGDAFRFGLFAGGSDVGHTAVIGPTGAGKSVLLAFLALSWPRHEQSRVVIIDRHMSCRAAVLAAGGRFHRLDGADCAFQPLRSADETAALWLLDALAHAGVAIDQEVRREAFGVIGLLTELTADERTLSAASALLGREHLREALATLPRWFDAVESGDKLAAIEAFETDHLLRHKAAPLAIAHLLRRLESRFDGSPTLLVLDEAWWALSHGEMGAAIDDWLRTLRKKNVAVVFATQALGDLVGSPFASTLLEQVPNRIFLPNPRALEPVTRQIYASLGLGPAMIDMIGAATPKRDYIFQSPDGVQCLDLALGPTALAVCARSTPADQRLLDRLPPDDVLEELLGGPGRQSHEAT